MTGVLPRPAPSMKSALLLTPVVWMRPWISQAKGCDMLQLIFQNCDSFNLMLCQMHFSCCFPVISFQHPVSCGEGELGRYSWKLSETCPDLLPRCVHFGLDLWQLDRPRRLGGRTWAATNTPCQVVNLVGCHVYLVSMICKYICNQYKLLLYYI